MILCRPGEDMAPRSRTAVSGESGRAGDAVRSPTERDPSQGGSAGGLEARSIVTAVALGWRADEDE